MSEHRLITAAKEASQIAKGETMTTLTKEQIAQIEHAAHAGIDVATGDQMLELCRGYREALDKRPRPIEDAPKDGTIIFRKYVYIVHPVSGELYLGYWNPDKFSKKPRPFWDYAMFRTTSSRANQPTHFIPLSALTVKP